MASSSAWRLVPDPETSTTRRLATGLAATVGPFLGGAFPYGRPYVRSYECFAPRDTGKSTKRPTVSNDTGTPGSPHGTGARPEGSVWESPGRERGRRAVRFRSGSSCKTAVRTPDQRLINRSTLDLRLTTAVSPRGR